MSEQNHGKSWNADLMIRNAKALQRVVKELEKNRSKLFPITPRWHVFGNSQSIVACDRNRAEGLAVSGTTKGS